tara:strand:- start:95 stop:814 length:720 start_codon:yes stop_codon:yes gene_type:complete
MKTSQRSIFDLIEETSTSFQAASPANHLAQQEKEKERKTIDISGRKCLEQFERLNQPTLWGKMFAASLIGQEGWFSTRCVLTWKLVGTQSNRFYFQLAPSTLPINETEFGLLQEGMLPTPTASPTDASQTVGATERLLGDKVRNRKQGQLMEAIVMGMLPTPATRDYKGANSLERTKSKIEAGERAHMGQLPNAIAIQTGKTSQLNPRFVAEMMGFPPNWTELPFQNGETNPSKPMETQ